jgi:hypothetical protein
MSLQQTRICLPTKIIAVNERDSQVIFIGWHMRKMSVNSLGLGHGTATERANLLSLSLFNF